MILVAKSARIPYLLMLDRRTFHTTKHGSSTSKISVMILIAEIDV